MGLARMISFVAVMLLIYAGMHALAYRSLQPLFGSVPGFRWMMLALMLAFPLVQILSHNTGIYMGLWPVRLTSFWLGIVFQLFIWFLLFWILKSAAGLFLSLPGGLDKWAAGVIPAFVLAMSGYGLFEALRTPDVVTYRVDRSERFGRGKTLRLVQLSDLHLGSSLGRECLRKIVGRTLEQKPDLILLTGDLVDMDVRNFEGMVPLLKALKAPLGTFAITGNHEYYSGIKPFLETMDHCGIPVLRNRGVRVGEGFQVLGVDDLTAERMGEGQAAEHLRETLSGYDPALPSVLMHHQPKGYEAAVDRGVDLILSGHTHAGQIFPFQFFVRRAFKYISGLNRVGPVTDLAVSNGTGFWGPPIRTCAPAQIVLIEFRY